MSEVEIQRTLDPAFINYVINHPSVRPTVADTAAQALDVSADLSNQQNIALVGEHGATVYYKVFDGGYEVHTAILPSGRGKWAKVFAENSLLWMFTGTDCVEVLTRVPEGHVAARALTLAVGFREQFKTPPECHFQGKRVPATIYSLMLQDWWLRTPGMEERGAAFHDWMNAYLGKTAGEPHEPDPIHNRIVGVAFEMVMMGRARKAVIFYNRAARLARHPLISLVNESPVQIKFDAGILTFADNRITIEACH